MTRQRSAHPAFTLVEMLLVVAIIVILIGMLLPSLGRAKVRDTGCKANLKVIGDALVLYAFENSKFPGHLSQGSNIQQIVIWAPRLRKYAGSEKPWYCPSQPASFAWVRSFGTSYGGGTPYASHLDAEWGYEKYEKMISPHTAPSSYGYNDWGCHQMQKNPQRGLGGDIRAYVNAPEVGLRAVRNPVAMMAIMDSTTNGSFDWNVDPNDPGEYPGKIHDLGANVVHVDAHVEWIPQAKLVNISTSTPEGLAMRAKWNSSNQSN